MEIVKQGAKWRRNEYSLTWDLKGPHGTSYKYG